MRRPVLHALGLALLCAAGAARASTSAGIRVTHFVVTLSALRAGVTPAVSFAGAIGSTSESTASSGGVTPDQDCTAGSATAFGQTASATAADPFAGASAALAGDVFGAGALVTASAYASSRVAQSAGSATIGLADGVVAARFTLAPDTRMTLSADVLAWASATGDSASEVAGGSLLMAIGDETGLGPQREDVNFNAFALGATGTVDDIETTVVQITYENDSDVAIAGLFSGYVAAYADSGTGVSAVPEPGSGWMAAAGLLLVAGLRSRPGKAKSRREAGFREVSRAPGRAP